jgi:hypothetical protein
VRTTGILGRTKILGLETKPLHLERGWEKQGDWLLGYYRTKHGAWPGAIHCLNGSFRVLIGDIREQDFKRHPHWRCFHYQKKGWYSIHMAKLPADGAVDGLILCVEQIIDETVSLARR